MLSPRLTTEADQLAARFRVREPFRHVVIDDFFALEDCAQLLAQFPPFERGNAHNEDGQPGAKSTIENLRGLGPAFVALDNLVQDRKFLDFIGHITGIPDLRYDPWYFGGGTHENRTGQDLDVHVDFNRHPIENWHRRLNLIVYLNKAWDDAWGGVLELHSDPRAADDRVTTIAPLYNRAVIFETTEWSWHGFSRIEQPGHAAPLSRKSIALYFYSTSRPEDELADTHSTIYVDRPLPAHFRPGMVLGAADVEELRTLLARRDQHNQRLYKDLAALNKQFDRGWTGLLRWAARFVRKRLGRVP